MILLLFFLSGAAGLIYQVTWVRGFGNVFGNTVWSATFVTSIFMLGLGFGSWLAGAWVDKHWRGRAQFPLKAYAYFELAIGVLGLLVALVLPSLEAISAAISLYDVDERGWHHLSATSYVLRTTIAALLLLPSTLLMGGTLTLLIRYLLREDLSAGGWKIAALYGVNTAGAAAGSVLTDFFLVPNVGIFGAQGVAAAANLVAGLGALRLAERVSAAEATAPAPASLVFRFDRDVGYTAAALFFSGAIGMGFEILWFRFLSSVLGLRRPIFSLLLTVILVGIWLGSLAGGALQKKFGRPAVLFAATQTLLVLTAALTLALFDREFFHRLSLTAIIFVTGAPSLLMGAAYPLANASIQRVAGDVGSRAGILYLFNTLGAVIGALLTGFVLLPAVGMQFSVIFFFGAAIACVLLLGRTDRWPGTVPLAAVLLAGAVVWRTVLPPDLLLEKTFQKIHGKTLAASESVTGTIKIVELDEGYLALFTDGHAMSGTRWDAQRYMRAFAHLPLLHSDAPKSALVICFGVGTTLNAASLHPTVNRLDIVDISRDVLEHGHYFAASNGNILKDPRTKIFVNDGRQHLRMTGSKYDLITLEPPPIAEAGVASLYSTEFYQLAKNALEKGGFVTQWLPAYQVPGEAVDAVVRAFVDVFPGAIMISGYHNELVLMGNRDGPVVIDPHQLAARLDRAPLVRADLERVHLGSLTDLIGTFAADGARLATATQDAAPVTDDYPILEYSHVFDRTPIPADLFGVSGVKTWCPSCFGADGKPIPELADLDVYLTIMSSLYASEQFLADRPAPVVFPREPRIPGVLESNAFFKLLFSSKR